MFREVIEIFKTNIQAQNQANEVYHSLIAILPEARISFDLDDQDKILRIENTTVDPDLVTATVTALGYLCKVMPDKICSEAPASKDDMEAFWDNSFIAHQTMWGFEPAVSAVLAKGLFQENHIKDIIVPGIGYGRNAQVFTDSGMKVTGIEISPTAIGIARKHYGPGMKIYQGSVTDMPFDDHLYEGIFCYGLLYLLDPGQRKKMIADCYNQLKPGGLMIFSVISKNSPNYGKGREVRKDTFEIGKGGQLFFYDTAVVKEEFEASGLTDFFEMDEPHNAMSNVPPFKFIFIKCKKR